MGMEGWWAVAHSLGETIAWFRSRADAEDYRKYLAARGYETALCPRDIKAARAGDAAYGAGTKLWL